jgi:hypothetical protein
MLVSSNGSSSDLHPFPELPFSIHIRSVRPSITDRRFSGDPWIINEGDNSYLLCLGDYGLANVEGLELDMPGLNGLLDRIRNRKPRGQPQK